MNATNNKKKNYKLYLLIGIACFILDRTTKTWALHALSELPKIISPNLNLILLWNRGVTWGLFHSISPFGFFLLTLFILLVIIFFFLYTFVQYKNCYDITFETLVLAGALSNIVDRFWYGAVIDFIEFHVYDWFWPVFNFADVFVVIGITGMMFKYFLGSYVFKNKKALL